MFQSWRFKLREAEEAWKAGRLEEARRLMEQGDLAEFLPGKRLAARLARSFARRAHQQAECGRWEAGWRDLEAALSLAEENAQLASVRQALIQASLRESEEHLVRGNADAALVVIDKLRRRKLDDRDLQALYDVARRVDAANHLCRRGRFAEAESHLEAASLLRPDLAELKRRRDACRLEVERAQQVTDELHRALSERRWRNAAALADQLLALAPESRLARDARRRAWAEVGSPADEPRHGGVTQSWRPAVSRTRTEAEPGISRVGSGPRFLLWVDGVGGYLVCLAEEVLCGQAAPANSVDVPLLADISRRHAKIRREGEAYILEPLHATRLDGRCVQDRTLLSDGAEIELGAGVRLRFRQPHALSGTARLEFASRYRTQPHADGILLMAESCVLGPNWQNHVVCRDWAGDVVLYRQGEELYCRAMDSIEVDGRFYDGRGPLDHHSHVVGSDFSMSLEELDRCAT